jgi:hypothetical protein
MAVARCPACGHLPGEIAFSPEEQITAWAVELTRASTVPSEDPREVGRRLRVIRTALATLDEEPADAAPPAA